MCVVEVVGVVWVFSSWGGGVVGEGGGGGGVGGWGAHLPPSHKPFTRLMSYRAAHRKSLIALAFSLGSAYENRRNAWRSGDVRAARCS